MKSITYRKATADDLNSIVSIYNEIISEGGFSADLDTYEADERVQWFREVSTEPYGIYVVMQEQMIIGFFYFSPWRKGRRALAQTAEVSFYLSASSRGSGIGNQIMTWIIELAAIKGIKSLIAILLDTNKRSKHLLEKYGFAVAGHLKDVVQLEKMTCGQLLMLKKN